MALSERFARSVVRHRGRWTLGALLCFVLAALLSLRLSLREDIRDFEPRRSAPTDSLEAALHDLLGGADRIVVLLEAAHPLVASQMAPALDSLAARLARVRGVRGVQYRLRPELRAFLETRAEQYALLAFDTTQLAALGGRLGPDSIRRLVRAADSALQLDEGPDPSRVIDPLRLLVPAAAMLARAAGGANLRLQDGYLALPGESGFLFVIEPQSTVNIAQQRALVGEVEAVLSAAPHAPALAAPLAGTRLTAIGRPVGMIHFFRTAVSDVARVAVASLVLGFLLQLLMFRRLLAPLLLALTAIYALALTGAIAALLFGALSLVAWLFIGVLVGLGDEFGLYVASHYWITGEVGRGQEAALASALARPGRGLLYSGLAMAAAFATLALFSYPVMLQLACITALGLLAMMLCSFTVLPIALAYCVPSRRVATRWSRGMAAFYRSGERHPWRWLSAWTLLLSLCFWSARTLPLEPHPWKVALRGNPFTGELERVRRLLGVWPSPILMVSSGRDTAEAIEHDREAVYQLDRVGSHGGVVMIESLTRWLPPAGQQASDLAWLRNHRETFSSERVRRGFLDALAPQDRSNSRLVDEYLPRVLRLLDTSQEPLTVDGLRDMGLDSLVRHHVLNRGSQVLAVSYVYLAETPWAAGVTDRFEQALKLGEGDALSRARFLGDALRGATHADQLRHDIVRATGVALALVGLLLLIQFRRLGPALLGLLPLLCAIGAALGTMKLLGSELNVLTLSIAPLLIGLCVDDGIHLLERLERGEQREEILRDAGAAIVITTLTTVAGFAALGFARFPGIGELGVIGSVGILVALAASLQLVPLCHSLLPKAASPRLGKSS